MPVHKDHQGKVPQPLFCALGNFCPLWQLRVSSELGCWALLCALTHSAPEPKRLHRGAPKLLLALDFVQPGFAGHVCAGEFRALTPGVLDEEAPRWRSEDISFTSRRLRFFLFRARNVSEKCHRGKLMLINLATQGGIEGPAPHACDF